MSVSEPMLTDTAWDLTGGYVEDWSCVMSPTPAPNPVQEPPPRGSITSSSAARREELRALEVSAGATVGDVITALRRHYPAGLKGRRLNPYTGLPFTAATERWASQ